MESWYEEEFRKRGHRPGRAECYAKGRELGFTQAQTIKLLQGHPEWTRSIPPKLYGQHQLRLFSRGQIDLGFLRFRKKDFGLFFLGEQNRESPTPPQRAPDPSSPSLPGGRGWGELDEGAFFQIKIKNVGFCVF